MSASETEVGRAALQPVDARIAVATKHWGPRFVAQGVDLNDFNRTLTRITRWDDWCREWGATGANTNERPRLRRRRATT